ncbi:hypothetical protein [Rhodalgimonas zhirmunskyi]|uniref:Sulfotransferase family protein n=1 Tax=Rhodalgimonas zhirmunskyi TaxID=2964767 RepID=A0AAJ1U2R8_9RHOB|nr:hypothetical protein [Rhodoalgimonas zhirmunskyi]MDQ2092626.1 sulfotransferase family protein [Rhodoalgimonas zhirmunskyi]
MSRLIVVNLGLPKSGTTTLARALREAGFKVADHHIRKDDTPNKELHNRLVGGRMYRGYFASGDPLEELHEFDAFSEINGLRGPHSLWPQTDFGVISALREFHPGIRFLASSRDPKDQAMSMLKWSDLGTDRLPSSTVPGLPKSYGQTLHERAKWIAAHHAFLRKIFEGSKDFLEYDIADTGARDKIAAFLGREMPWWGRLNANDPERSAKRADKSGEKQKKTKKKNKEGAA